MYLTFLYADDLFHRLKNISFSRDEEILYVTTLGGGTYRMKTGHSNPDLAEYRAQAE